jgi:CDP-glycerol glycerophosphotransferase (TagB/SpsB family)
MIKTILIVITDQFDERFLLASGVVNRLTENGKKIIIASPNANNILFIEEYKKHKVHFELINEKIRYPLFNYYFTLIWRYSQASESAPKWREDLMELKGKSRIFWVFNFIFNRQKWFFGLLRILDRYIVNISENYKYLFEKYEIDLTVTTNDFSLPHRLMVREANRNGIKTLMAIRSWDNLVTRGYFFENVNYYIVWNNENQNELIKYHNVKEENIFVCGAPHFDIYNKFAKVNKQKSRLDYCEKRGFDSDKRIIYILGSQERSGWMLNDIIEILVNAAKHNKYIYPCQFLIRPHPSVVSGSFRGPGTTDDLDYYKSLSDDIHIDMPKLIEKDEISRLEKDDMLRKAENLFFSDVVINFYSTISIEAAAVDAPIINIGFDGHNNSFSVRKFELRIHNKNILNTGGIKVALSPDDLIKSINIYLKNPEKDRNGRKLIVKDHFYKNDGNATLRVADIINRLVSS